MCPGACKDRLADAIARHGRVPIVQRRRTAHPEDPIFRLRGEAPFWAAGGLIHDGHGAVVLVRAARRSTGRLWSTPGGLLEEGETVDEGLRREVREEVGIALRDTTLSRIFNETIVGGSQIRHGYFAQFTAGAASAVLRLGREEAEARWFRELPSDLAFREDYVEDFARIRDAARF